MPVSITIAIPENHITNAILGGIDDTVSCFDFEEYVEPTSWDDPSSEKYSQYYPLQPGGALLFSDRNEDTKELLRLDRASLEKGLQVLAEQYPHHFVSIVTDESDAETGNVLLQCCLLGEIVYC